MESSSKRLQGKAGTRCICINLVDRLTCLEGQTVAAKDTHCRCSKDLTKGVEPHYLEASLSSASSGQVIASKLKAQWQNQQKAAED